MVSPASPERPPTRRRKPLSDTTAWVNNQSSTSPLQSDSYTSLIPPISSTVWASSQPKLPHHESLAPGGTLQVRNKVNSPASKAEDKRISAISSEDARNDKRDSQVSNSTNASGKSRRKTHVGPWRLGATIGKGATGRVRKARHAVTQQDAAIKIVSKKQAAEMLRSGSLAVLDTMLRDDGQQRVIPFGIEREVVIMKLIEHPNVIKIYDVWENRGELYLVLEYVQGGELFDHIVSNHGLPESEAIRIFRQMIAGLSYCHRFSICHRDLKPENILLDSNRNVKIVDFGMAALQPAKQYLRTACGSPHYAAPEVIRSEGYSGDKADVWSCGVILFAMIVGTLPFDGVDFDQVIQAVLTGEYEIPAGVSEQAADLIYRMLQPNPKQRIPMKQIWQHPIVQKYANLDCTDAQGRAYIGPATPLTSNDCGPRIWQRTDIDGEILRNLQNLWHGASEEEIAQKLLSDAPNHEKVLYTKLLKFREEQLEHYDGPPMDYSISDYHHNPPSQQMLPRSRTRTSLQMSHGARRASQYSLVDRSKLLPPKKASRAQSVNRQPSIAETEGSYDPFNPARTRISSLAADHARITLLSSHSQSPSKSHSDYAITKNSARVPSLARVRAEEDNYSMTESLPGRRLYSAGSSRLMANRHMSRASSRMTMASRRSITSNSSVIVARRPSSYKCAVSFQHNRNRPVSGHQKRLRSQEVRASPFTLQERYQRDQKKVEPPDITQTITQAHAIAEEKGLPDSPTLSRETPQPEVSSMVRSRKAPKHINGDGDDGVSPTKRTRLSNRFRDDARIVSLEMEKLCEEAFNRPRGSPITSRNPTPKTTSTDNRDSQRSYRTNASATTADTSFSIHEDPLPTSTTRRTQTFEKSKAYNERPLPQPPATERQVDTEYLGSYTQRELAKTRELLIKRRDESMIGPGYLDEVIAHLDRLMQPSAIRLADEKRRAISTPDGMPRKDTFEDIMQKNNIAFRSASEPDGKALQGPSIRLVDGHDGRKPISPVKPLTIRKRSESSTPSGGSPRQITPTQRLFVTEDLYRPLDEYRSAGLALSENRELERIEEDDDKENFDPVVRPREVHGPKKRNWFHRHQQLKTHEDGRAPIPPIKDQQPGGQNGTNSEAYKRKSDAPSEDSQGSNPKSKSKSSKGRFLKIFSGKRESKDPKNPIGLDYDVSDEASIATQETYNPQQAYMTGALTNASRTSIQKHVRNRSHGEDLRPPRTIQPQHQNWFARLLRIKPAVIVLCFQAPQVRARKEVTSVFKHWKKYGMRDIVVDKAAGRVWARVDVKNSLNIPSLSLAAEFHTLLHCGRRSNLAIARFTQERGAKSSFLRIMEALEQLLKTKGILVEDTKLIREMRAGAGM